MIDLQNKVASALLDINAVGFRPKNPITFKSGIISPVYVDNRKLPFYPKEWQIVIKGFQAVIQAEKISFDVLAGVAVGGVPHSSALGFKMKKPSVFVRKKLKDHGTGKLVEGGDVEKKKVLLLEDLVTTGGSSLDGVKALRDSKAIANDCLVIISYGFKESKLAFKKAKVKLHALTTFKIVLAEALKRKLFSLDEKKIIEEWFQDPWNWGRKHGFSK